MRAIFFVPLGLLALVVFDQGYFDELQGSSDGGAISEGFIRKGALGKLLRDGGYLGISADSGKAVSDRLCAPDEVLKGFDRHDLFRIRVTAQTNIDQDLRITIRDSRKGEATIVSERMTIVPRQESYSVYFNAEKNTPLTITFSTSSRQEEPMLLGSISLDGQYGRQRLLYDAPETLLGSFAENARSGETEVNGGFRGVMLDQPGMQLEFYLPGGVPGEMYVGTFPGKKNQGFCRYSAITQPLASGRALNQIIPKVSIEIDQEYLTGEEGVLSHRESKGRAWEVPAIVSIDNGRLAYSQAVGLRTHGGTKGRQQDIESYRLYARRAYGKNSIQKDLLFDPPGDASLEALVLKYTYQVYGSYKEEFNPFLHSLAMEIADRIGALVPRHQLVQFEMNKEPKGLYLAMEHLSDRTVRNWLGRDNFIGYVYKKYNTPREQDTLYLLLAQITAESGEAALAAMEQFYDIDNVINSIILSAYIADDDFCQGMEIIDNLENLSEASITTVNWDLDHGFLLYKDGKFSATPERPAFWLLKPQIKSPCPRRWAYSWVYAQSETFREMFRSRLETLLSGTLSLEGLKPLLEYYQTINREFYGGRHDAAIEQLEYFIEQRGPIMLEELALLEKQALVADVQVANSIANRE